MFNRHVAFLAFGAVLAAVVGAAAQSGVINASIRTVNNVTFSHAFALPGVTLPAGTYLFESGPSGTDPDVVRVSSITKNRQKIFYQGFTTALAHPAGHSVVAFGEAAARAAQPVVAWYPIGTKSAHGFQYP